MFALAVPLAASYMMLSMVRLPRPPAAVHARVIQTSQRVQSVPLASNATQAARSMLFRGVHRRTKDIEGSLRGVRPGVRLRRARPPGFERGDARVRREGERLSVSAAAGAV